MHMRKQWKKIISMLLVVILFLADLPGSIFLTTVKAETYTNGDISFNYSKAVNGNITITKYTGTETSVVIPDEINGNKVVAIGDYAFSEMSNLKEVEFGENITSIGYRAFYKCSGLTELKLPEGLKTIGEYAFQYCDGLTEVEVPDSVEGNCAGWFNGCGKLEKVKFGSGVTSIGDYAFSEMSNLKEVEFGENIISIGYRTFYKCSGLTELKLPEGLRTIDGYAFQYCNGLTEVEVPDSVEGNCEGWFNGCGKLEKVKFGSGVTSIGDYAFSEMSNLKEVEFGENITSIGYRAFYKCSGLTELKLPAALKTIDGYAFQYCDRIQNIYFYGTAPEITAQVFPNTESIYAYYDNTKGNWAQMIATHDKITWINWDAKGIDEVRLFSEKALSSLRPGDTIDVLAALYTDGEQAASEEGFSFVISDSSVADYGNIENTDNGTKITIKAKNEGTATLTVTDNATGKKAYGTISVSDGYFNIAANAMPVYKEGKDEYNCYTSGMYITDFKQEIINDDYNLVTMNVYNETSVIGVVEVYDSNGKLVKCEKIDKFGGNNITSLKGTVLSSLLLLQDAFTQNMLSFKSERFTKKTSISISVPRGGYIKVSNNINDSAYCTVYNFVDMLVFVWKEVGNIQKSDNMEVALRDKLVETFTSQMKEETFNFLVKEARTILSVSATMGDAKQHVNEVAESLNKVIQTLDINIGDLILNTMIDVGYSVEQKAYNELITITGFPKASLDLVFKIGKYGNFLTQIVQTAQCAYSNVLRIDTTNAQNELIDNGVKVDAGSSGGFVMRSYQVTEGEEYNAAQNALSAISDKFKVYDIYMMKKDEVVQPESVVKVSVPIPQGYDRSKLNIYRIEADGSKTNMKAHIEGDYLVFETNHFSTYAIVEEEVVRIAGDIDGNGKVNLQDSALLRRYLAGWDVTIDESVADVDGNGKVNLQDSALIRRYLAGWDVELR